jgi:hypothetical protein
MDMTEYEKLNSLEDQIKETNKELRRINTTLDFIGFIVLLTALFYVVPTLYKYLPLLLELASKPST